MIDFELECDGDGGITLIDSDNLKNLNNEIGTLLTIAIDVMGETELSMDYPNEEWSGVWLREVNNLQKICNNGLMFTGLLEDNEYNVGVDFDLKSRPISKGGLLEITGNTIIAVETGELIQKILYPKLSLEILMELEATSGKYKVQHDISSNNLKLNLTPIQDGEIGIVNNVVDICKRNQ
jgi:hypothetical protein